MENNEEILSKENIEKVQTIAIYGDTGSGKTALSYAILEALKHRDIYFIKHPRPELLKKFGYKNLDSAEELEQLNNCVVYFDEPQLSLNIYDKKSNAIIAKVCSLARQRDIILILSSSDTRVFTKHNEAYIDLWLIKDVDFSMVKRGSKIREIIRENCFIDPKGFKLSKDEFVSNSRKIKEFNGRHKFKLIDNWNNDLSNPYNLAKAKETAMRINNNCETAKEIEITKEQKTIEDFKLLCRKWSLSKSKEGILIKDKCSICGFTDIQDLHIHHNAYTYPFNINDSVILCRSCHKKEHDKNKDYFNKDFLI